MSLLRDLLDKLTEWQVSRTLRKCSDFSIEFAGMCPSGSEGSGGALKLTVLRGAFPTSDRGASLLYLVSSALPRGAVGWARAAKKQGIPVVLNQNGVAFPAWASDAERVRINQRNKKLFVLADLVIFQSKFCELASEKWVGGVDGRRARIYNPVDTKLFRPGTPDTDFLLAGSVAQPERVRKPLEALSAARKSGKQWTMCVAGPMRWHGGEDEISRWILELGLSGAVKRVKFFDRTEAPALFRSARALIHLQDKDASPTVPLEALASGCAVLGLRSGAMPELVPEKMGVLLTVKDDWTAYHYPSEIELLSGMEQVLKLSPGESGWRWVDEHFSNEKFVNEHRHIFKEISSRSE